MGKNKSNKKWGRPIVRCVDSYVAGPTVTIMTGVHGNEISGVEALKKAISNVKIRRGKVYFIIANPGALAHQKRQLEMNLNRAFLPPESLTNSERTSYERFLAECLMPYLNKSDALLDLHSTLSSPAIPFVICEPNGFKIARKIPFDIISIGWGKTHPGSTDAYMNNRDKIGICVECGQHNDPKSRNRAEDAIGVFLGELGLIKKTKTPGEAKDQRIIQATSLFKCRKNFVPSQDFADFSNLNKDQLIGTDGGKKIYCPEKGMFILFCYKCQQPGQEAFALAREITVD